MIDLRIGIKDAGDIGELVHFYPAFEDDNVWDNHADLFAEGIEMIDAGQVALGREIGAVFGRNPSLHFRISDIIERLASDELSGLQQFQTGLRGSASSTKAALQNLLYGFRQNWQRTDSPS